MTERLAWRELIDRVKDKRLEEQSFDTGLSNTELIVQQLEFIQAAANDVLQELDEPAGGELRPGYDDANEAAVYAHSLDLAEYATDVQHVFQKAAAELKRLADSKETA